MVVLIILDVRDRLRKALSAKMRLQKKQDLFDNGDAVLTYNYAFHF